MSPMTAAVPPASVANSVTVATVVAKLIPTTTVVVARVITAAPQDQQAL